jgi:hypothetical protein
MPIADCWISIISPVNGAYIAYDAKAEARIEVIQVSLLNDARGRRIPLYCTNDQDSMRTATSAARTRY